MSLELWVKSLELKAVTFKLSAIELGFTLSLCAMLYALCYFPHDGRPDSH